MKMQRSISSTTPSSRTVNENVNFAKFFQGVVHSSRDAFGLPDI